MEGIKGYWRKRSYQRLDGSGRRRSRRVELARMGGPNRRRRFWQIRVAPRLRFLRLSSARKFFARIRDAYVKMMLSFANSRVFSGGFAYGGEIGYGFGKGPLKEYDEKMIVKIYKSLLEQGQLVAVDGARTGGEIVLRR